MGSTKEYNKKYSEEHKEELKAKQKIYYEANREIITEKKRKYREINKEKIAAYAKIYREKNKELEKERKRKYEELNKEQIREKHKKYYIKNREHLIKYALEYHNSHKKQKDEYRKKYYKAKKDEFTIRVQKRRAKQKNLAHTLTQEQWSYIVKYFDNRCAYCGKEKQLDQEHFVPLSKGGEYTHNNIIPVCRSCNSKKHDADFFEWYPKQKFYSELRKRNILKFLNYKNDKTQQLTLLTGE